MPKILIVDDDATIQMELEEYLNQLGHTVVGIADTGEGAVEMTRETNPDLILMDINLPGEMDGISAAEKIKEEMDVAVVFVTGFGDPEHIERAKLVEPFGFVMKPFDEQEINGVIEIVLQRRKMELELARVHKKLEESEERFRTIYEKSPIGIEIYDADGRLDHVNKACLDIFGASDISEIIGFRLFEDPNIPVECIKHLQEGKNVRYEVAFDFEKIKTQKLYETTKSGIVYLDVQITPLGYAAGGSITGYLVQIVDINDYKRMETALKKSEEKFRLIAETSEEDVWQLDLKGKVTYVSPAVKKIFGYTPEEAMDLDFAAFFPESELERATRVFSRVVSDKRHQLLEMVGKRKDGSAISIEISVTPIIRSNTIVGVQGITRDISSRKQAQAALRESESFFSQIFEQSTTSTCLYNPDGTIHGVNNEFCKMFGVEEKVIINAGTEPLRGSPSKIPLYLQDPIHEF